VSEPERRAGQPERAADASIDEARDAARQPSSDGADGTRRLEDGGMHLLHEVGQTGRGVSGESPEA
jgi:hypothetical protein